MRLLLAGTLSPSYGIYSGFECIRSRRPATPARRSTSTPRSTSCASAAFDGPLLPRVAQLNRIRREQPALQRIDNLAFLPTENDALLAYAKRAGGETLITVANLDPRNPQEGIVVVPGETRAAAGLRV